MRGILIDWLVEVHDGYKVQGASWGACRWDPGSSQVCLGLACTAAAGFLCGSPACCTPLLRAAVPRDPVPGGQHHGPLPEHSA